MWMELSDTNASDTYDGAWLQLGAAAYCTKLEFGEQLLLRQLDEIREGMIATVFTIENFMRAADLERAKLKEQVKTLQSQLAFARSNHPPRNRFRDSHLN
jgi:hypothetical protein